MLTSINVEPPLTQVVMFLSNKITSPHSLNKHLMVLHRPMLRGCTGLPFQHNQKLDLAFSCMGYALLF